MKTILTYTFLIISALIFIYSVFTRVKLNVFPEELTKISVSNNNINVGEVTQKSQASAEFYIKNIGDKELRLSNVEVSCSCSSTTLLDTSILPNDSLLIKVQYNKNIKGYFYSDVIVYGNFSGSPKFLSFEGFYNID